ncbi:MAG TPA: hypothetical protein LFV66_00450 [Rickettsia endosymbiont of Bembidion lapponicum]|nr:hypothetical protein [Rickettsia endosymbiont of Bembidion lapponicum]
MTANFPLDRSALITIIVASHGEYTQKRFNNYEYKNIQEHKALKEVLRKYHPEQKSNGDVTFLVNNVAYAEKFSKSAKTETDNL